MFVTKIKIATTIALMASMCLSVFLTEYSSLQAALALLDSGNEDPSKLAEIAVTMFPDGLKHDFGTVQMGTEAKHTFHIVNTSNVPLKMLSLRATGPITARWTKPVLQPHEDGKVEISVDTKRFRGPRTFIVWLEMDNREGTVIMFTITADSQDAVKP